MKKVKDVYIDYIDYLKIKNRITTVYFVKLKFENYIIPYFGNIAINEITENDYINFQSKIMQLKYSKSFYDQIFYITKNFFKYLSMIYKIENIPENVGKIKIQEDHNKREHIIWTKKEFKKFIKKVDDPIYHAYFNLLFYCGLRKSEALALKIKDFNNNTICVKHSISKELYNGEHLLLPTKSGKERKIRIDFFLRHELKNLIKYYNKNYPNCNENSFLFGCDSSIPCTTLKRKKDNWCDMANLPHITIHDFRHSHATMLYRKKVDIKSIQRRLGHADAATTINTYVHTNEKDEKRLIKKINLAHF